MPGTNKVTTNSLSWSEMGSSLFETGIDLSKSYVGNKMQLQIDASKRDTMDKAAQTDTAMAGTKAKTFLFVGVGLIAVIIGIKIFKKRVL